MVFFDFLMLNPKCSADVGEGIIFRGLFAGQLHLTSSGAWIYSQLYKKIFVSVFFF